MEGCMPNVVKYLLFATNFLVFVMGCVVLGFGIYVLSTGQDVVDLVNTGSESNTTITLYSSAAVLLIIVSVFVITVTFFGCCGAIKENKCMLGTYFSLILVMFVVMIVAAVMGTTQTLASIKEPLVKSMKHYNPDSTEKKEQAIVTSWDNVQSDFKCCGVNDFSEWRELCPHFESGDILVPASCCTEAEAKDACQKTPQAQDPPLKGCFSKLEESIDQNKSSILSVAVVIIVIMLANMIAAFVLCLMTR